MEEYKNGELPPGGKCSSVKLDKCEVTISFRNGSWWKQNRMSNKVKLITLWTQTSK